MNVDKSAETVSSCPDKERMGEFACTNPEQCWEPCGELGKSEEHARVAEGLGTSVGTEDGGSSRPICPCKAGPAKALLESPGLQGSGDARLGGD